ncbi:MAG TPA: hypothetical protein VF533_10795, partial [Solirubrobacteraceae bacterium]
KGGFGADRLDGGPGADLLDGYRNDGSDPDHNGLSAAGEEGDRDVSIENAFGGAGPDVIRSALAGPDILSGLGGDDRIFARDGCTARDTVSCGAGNDTAQTDPSDARTLCEGAIP